MQRYTIGQISNLIGLPTKTIRFYEEIDLLLPATREGNGYRSYSLDNLEQLKLIKAARDLGLPISEIKKLMKGCEGRSCEHTKNEIESEISEYLQVLTEKIAQFTLLKTRLVHLKDTLRKKDDDCSEDRYCCNLLQQLTKGGE